MKQLYKPWSALLQLPLLLHVAASALLAVGGGTAGAAAAAFTALACGASAELLRAIGCSRGALQEPPGIQGLEQAAGERAGAQRARLMLGRPAGACACPGTLCERSGGGRERRQGVAPRAKSCGRRL